MNNSPDKGPGIVLSNEFLVLKTRQPPQ
jgi:hypothetical protein